MVSDERGGWGDRAQLVLVGAIAIGIVLIALTTVLNSAVFTENVAGGRSVEVTGDATEFDREAVRNVRSLVVRINHGEVYNTTDPDRTALNETVERNVGNYSRVLGESYADTGSVYVNVTYAGTQKVGTRIVQEGDEEFKKNDGSGTTTWEPIDGDAEIGWFVMNLDVENVSQSAPVTVRLTDETGAQLNVSFQRTAGGHLAVDSDIDGGNVSSVTCKPENGRVLLDVLGGESYSGDCSFNSTGYQDQPYAELKFVDGDNGVGKYDVVLNDSGPVNGVPPCQSGQNPCRGLAAWTIELRTHYQTGSFVYEKTHDVSVYDG